MGARITSCRRIGAWWGASHVMSFEPSREVHSALRSVPCGRASGGRARRTTIWEVNGSVESTMRGGNSMATLSVLSFISSSPITDGATLPPPPPALLEVRRRLNGWSPDAAWASTTPSDHQSAVSDCGSLRMTSGAQ